VDRRSPDDTHGMDYGDYLELLNKHLGAMTALEDDLTVEQLAERFDEQMLSRVLGRMQEAQCALVLARRQLHQPSQDSQQPQSG